MGHDEILKLHAAAIDANLVDSRAALLTYIDARILAGLPRVGSPGDQLLSDLGTLNAVGMLPDGTAPLATWLANAAELCGPRLEAAIFRAALSRCGAGSRLASALDAGAPSSRISDLFAPGAAKRWLGRRVAVSGLLGLLVAGPLTAAIELERRLRELAGRALRLEERLAREQQQRENSERRTTACEIDIAVCNRALADCKEARRDDPLPEEQPRTREPKRGTNMGRRPNAVERAGASPPEQDPVSEEPTGRRLGIDVPMRERPPLREHRIDSPRLREPAVSPDAAPRRRPE